jgi:hypothetical protein
MMNADRGLWPEWLDSVKRDLSWAAVEVLLGQPAFFNDPVRYYRAGRWPCAWEGANRSGRVVLLKYPRKRWSEPEDPGRVRGALAGRSYAALC